jgi:pimeloyl-ACP methyl ester carboxylesterase
MGHPQALLHKALDVNGYTFDAILMGPESGECVLLLHGFPQFADAWTDAIQSISEAGLHAVAIDQRGYSPGARPTKVEDYTVDRLTSDILGFADGMGVSRFHLIGHDWGGLLAWQLAADHPDRLISLTVLSTPHVNAFFTAVKADDDQREKSKYIDFFRLPGELAERLLLADDAQRLRSSYQGKLSARAVENNVRRLSEKGAMTSALNWYRALDLNHRIGCIEVPTLYIWGEKDHYLGETAALETAKYVSGSYHFERLKEASHWLLEEAADRVVPFLLEHLNAHRGDQPPTEGAQLPGASPNGSATR